MMTRLKIKYKSVESKFAVHFLRHEFYGYL